MNKVEITGRVNEVLNTNSYIVELEDNKNLVPVYKEGDDLKKDIGDFLHIIGRLTYDTNLYVTIDQLI